MKKYISLLLSLLLVCSMFVAVPTASALTFNEGSEIEATVIMPDVTSINGLEATLTYGDSLELEGVATPNIDDAIIGEHSNIVYINATKASEAYAMPDSVLCVATFTLTETVDVIDFAANVNQAYVLDGKEFVDVPADVVVTYKVDGEVPTEPTEPTTQEPTTEEPTTVPTTQPTTEVPTVELSNTYALAGVINGENVGIEEDSENADLLFDENGTYSCVITEKSYVGVKTADNSAYYWAEENQDFEAKLYNDMGYTGMVTVPAGYAEFKLIEKADGTLILTCTLSEIEPTEPTEPSEPSEPTEPSEPELPPLNGEYSLAGYVDGYDVGCNGDWENDPYIFVNNKVTINTTQENRVFLKTTDDLNWYFLPEESDDTTATFYSSDCNEMMVVPAGVVTFTLVENEDGSLTLSYVVEEEYTGPTEDTTPEKEYCLFGYINGANYGCEEDFESIGDYIFVDGTLTTTFYQDSYVAVKTTDNVDWYMTNGWVGEVSEAILYTTDITGVNSNKLLVPAGVITLTLVENEDGTLTLSFVIDSLEIPSESETTPTQSESSESTAPSESNTTPTQSEPSESTTPSESETTPTQPVKKPYLNITSTKVKAGATVKLEVKDNNTGIKPKFSVDNKDVVKVSAKGKVTACGKGTATITATVGSTKLTCKVKVTTNPKLTNTNGKKIKKVTIGVGGKATKVLISGKAAKLKNQYKSTPYVKVSGGKQKPFIKIQGLKAGKSTLEIKVNRSKTLKLKVTVK